MSPTCCCKNTSLSARPEMSFVLRLEGSLPCFCVAVAVASVYVEGSTPRLPPLAQLLFLSHSQQKHVSVSSAFGRGVPRKQHIPLAKLWS